MRFYSRFISIVLVVAAFWLMPIPAIWAQVSQPGANAVAAEDLPGAPEPQYPGMREQKDDPPAPALDPLTANIGGTVTDVNGDIVPGATIVLEDNASASRTAVANDSGAFQFDLLKPGIPYHITVAAKGFENWKSPTVILNPGQYFFVRDIKLKLPSAVTSVTVYSSREQIAAQQFTVEEHQRVFGIFPNFYVTYDKQAVPLPTKLKFKLAYKANTDVVTFFGIVFLAAIYQAGDIPNYGQGWGAYGKRVAAGYADDTTDTFIGGAILPWLLHQDPRYFYQGTGTTKSRIRHAVFSPFVCRGDNGKRQPNYSSMGGDLASGAISNLYYPQSNRGVELLFQGFAVTTGVRMVNGVLQEFVLRNLTPSARQQNDKRSTAVQTKETKKHVE
jgi:hypothetical protein